MQYAIGTRVRIVKVDGQPKGYLGLQGVITSYEDRIYDVGKYVPGYGLDISHKFPYPPFANGWGFMHDELEPILYDGNKLVEWEDCEWQPETVTCELNR